MGAGIAVAGIIPLEQQGQPPAPRPCYYLTFDAVPDDYIAINISLARPFTMVAWIYPRVAGTNQGLAGRPDAADYWVISGSALKQSVRHYADTPGTSTASITTAWQHVAAINRSSVADHKLFRNGVDVTSTPGVSNANAHPWTYIGRYWAGCLDGKIAAFGIAPAELDIVAMYAAGTFHRPLDPATFTIACWNMRNEAGAGVTLDDESASGNDGTFKDAGEPAWGGLMSASGPAGWRD